MLHEATITKFTLRITFGPCILTHRYIGGSTLGAGEGAEVPSPQWTVVWTQSGDYDYI